MRILATGMSGTVAPRFAHHARIAGHDITAWNRERVSPDDPQACDRFLVDTRPDAIVHMAFGAEAWAGHLAGHARHRGIPFVFTSTTMVFAARPDGPYTITSPRTATDEYGAYKIRCEDAIWASNADAMVARLGYQIDPDGRGNNLVAHTDTQQARDGSVRGGRRWLPACAFLDDTAAALLSLVTDPEPGLHHLDSNARTAWSHADILTKLAATLGRTWDIVETDDPEHDQRLLDSPRMPGLDTRLT
ncbi:MAG: NAD(P)-dependent oxidoreductase [Candidatus Nanopelagicales bacterium]|nr:NAD(P)-dependent oxidoreductase [Candidatus Nanopelagicales bacterium]